MFERSVIKRTGQWPKALVAFLGVIGGGVLMTAGFSRLGNAGRGGLAVVFGGMLLVAVSALIAVFAIRCPKCRMRWVWTAMRTRPSNEWFAWLLTRSDCPGCGHPGQSAGPSGP